MDMIVYSQLLDLFAVSSHPFANPSLDGLHDA